MFLVGFINPYTYENVFFPFLNYDPIMSKYIEELLPISLEISFANNFSVVFYSIIATIILIYIYYKKGTLRFRNLLLLGGITTMALINNRSFAFFIIICIPLLADYLKDIPYDFDNNYSNKKKIWVLIILFTLIVPLFQKNKLTSIVYKEANYIKNNYSKDVVLYTTFNEGSYCEYIGLHPYIDTRAEVFLKKENRKKDYFREFIKTYYGYKSPKYIIKKYKFTHFIVEKESHMYNYLNKQDKYIKKVFSKDFAVFILKD